MRGLQEEVATAWKVIRTEPIILRLRFSLSQYLDGPGKQWAVPVNTAAGLSLDQHEYVCVWIVQDA